LPSPLPTSERRQLFAEFGELMYEIQTFEFVLTGLVQTQEGEDLRGTPDFGPFIAELFRLTAGQLRRRAKIEDDELGELVEIAVNLRNLMVHGWLMHAGMDGAAGVRTTEELCEQVRLVRHTIHGATERLMTVWTEELDKIEEVDYLTPDKVAELWREGRAGQEGGSSG
jgi:hypothetical protein